MKKSILSAIVLSTALSSIQGAHASALVIKDDKRGILKVVARMVYSGPAATDAIAAAATREIEDMWNAGQAHVMINNRSYRVDFDVQYEMSSAKLKNPASCSYNFIKILNKTSPADRSYYTGLGSNTGVFYTSDNLGTSTTAAHEFGHGLTLDHNPMDQRAAVVPGIMFARGTLVRPEFQYDPKAPAGGPGGTINPQTRKVRAVDVKAIPFIAALALAQKNITCIGQGLPLRP